MDKKDCFSIGYVSRNPGLKGEIVITLDVDDPARYRSIDAVFLDLNGTLTPFFVSAARQQREQLTLSLDGIASADEARTLVGCEAWLPLSALPPLGETRFYFHEIPGYEVIEEHFGSVGIATGVIERTAQPVLAVQKGSVEILLPLPEGAVQRVDRQAKKLYLRAPEGLIGLYLGTGNDTPDDGD